MAALAVGARAADIPVSTDAQLSAALRDAVPGDRILLVPGVYAGGLYREGLVGVTLTSQDPANPAILDAGGSGEVLHLTSPANVSVEHLILQNFAANGINIDDGGNWPGGRARDITLRHLLVRNEAAPAGNRDGIKLSGVDDFLIDRVEVVNWGTGGSAIDPVGSHGGLIQNSTFTHATLSGGSGIRPKGGSKDIEIRANLLQLNAGRAIQAGGSTGKPFFRFVPGDSGYEADEIFVTGNIILGGESAVSWVNIDGGVFRHNYIEGPSRWIMRMLNENTGNPIVDTQNGVFADNIVVFDGGLSRISNHDGPEVLEATFQFARNHWYNRDTGGPSGEVELRLPAAESRGVYGTDPQLDATGTVAFPLPWGVWLVNPHAKSDVANVAGFGSLELAEPKGDASFEPLQADPFLGTWSFSPLEAMQIEVPGRSQIMLRYGAVVDAFHDYNGNGVVEQGDLDLVLLNWGRPANPPPAGWIRFLPSGTIDQDELDGVLLNWGHRNSLATSHVPEPATLVTVAVLFAMSVLVISAPPASPRPQDRAAWDFLLARTVGATIRR